MMDQICADASPPRPPAIAPMAFFRTINFSEPLASIAGEGVTLRTPQMTDYGEWSALREASREFLKPWEPTWPADDLTRSAFRRRDQALCRGFADRPGLRVPDRSQ